MTSFEDLRNWIGRSERAEDIAIQAPLTGLAATLDHDVPPWRAGEVPPLGHWLYFLPRAPQRDLAGDGHAHKGGFLPPVDLPRRMWAGGDLSFHQPIRCGEAISRHSVIDDVVPKQGRSGRMVFVKVRHEIATATGSAATEIHDIVYREAAKPDDPPPAGERPAEEPIWKRSLVPDPVLLFRYSALTFNGHRIHYDRSYCREVEGYPGLVFHGPLSATLLVDLYLRHNPGAWITGFRFRAKRPLFDIHALTLCAVPTASGARMWVTDHEGFVAMSAELDAG
ncbi:MaoC family dehydratase N-terminal domain-containing protein [Azospirillum sp.]|uniref:FAS1-like dehydratase domain-containing protein n=1 Tax=Azospirillum sp. TaxID=34012 RepID=UPI0026171096|nr:MaoC family dehydratase N-terminal domain-containing protein [Azospirillum sp.]